MFKVSFAGFFVVHWIAQFVSWSYADHSTIGHWCWSILATPLFHLSGALAGQYFWISTIINSAIWAAVLTFLLVKVSR